MTALEQFLFCVERTNERELNTEKQCFIISNEEGSGRYSFSLLKIIKVGYVLSYSFVWRTRRMSRASSQSLMLPPVFSMMNQDMNKLLCEL